MTGARNSRGFHLIKTLEWQTVRYAPPSQESLITFKDIKGFPGPFTLETFKKHDKSFQHQNCVRALLAPEATPLAMCVKIMDEKTFDYLKTLFNVSY
jgi:hypothetical protein